MCLSRLLLSVMLVISVYIHASAKGQEQKPADEYGLTVGKKMPFHVADFLNGKHQDHGGCPSVIIANSRGRGLIIWSRGPLEPAFLLAKTLDAEAADSDKLKRFLVFFDAPYNDLSEQAASFRHVVVGKARRQAKQEFDARGVEAKAQVLVFLLDKKEIKSRWTFASDELSDVKVKEVAAAAKAFAAAST